MKIVMVDLIGRRCITKEDGLILYGAIRDELIGGRQVTLDFSDVKQFASPFFNFGIGQLLNDIDFSRLGDLLRFENINETGMMVVDLVMENASNYIANSDYKLIVDDILEQQSKDSE